MSSTEAHIGHNQPPAVPEFVEFNDRLVELSARYGKAEYDLDDFEQHAQARADKLAIGRAISALDRAHQTLKGPLLEKTRVIDGERKRIKDAMSAIQNRIKAQLQEREQRAAARAEALNDLVIAIRQIGELPAYPGAARVAVRLEEAEAVDISVGFEERKPDAALAKTETIDALRLLFTAEQKREADAEAAERARQENEERERAAREEAIRKEATELARKEAEAAATAKIEVERQAKEAAEAAAQEAVRAAEEAERRWAQEAAEAAEADRKAKEEAKRSAAEAKVAEERRVTEAAEAEARAKAATERAATMAEERRAVDLAHAEQMAKDAAERAASEERDRIEHEHRKAQAEADANFLAEEAKKAKQTHRAKVHKAAMDSLVEEGDGISSQTARVVVDLIKDGKVKHVHMEY